MVNILAYYHADGKNKKLETVSKDGKKDVDAPAMLDIGESIPGMTQKFKVIVENVHPNGYGVQLRNPTTTDKDLKVESFPKFLSPGQKGEIEFLYSPAKDRINPLKAKWAFDVVVIG